TIALLSATPQQPLPAPDPALLQRFVEATPETREAIAAGVLPDEISSVRSAMQDLAIAHTRQGRQQEALRLLDTALAISAREATIRGRLNVLLTLSQAYGIAGRYEEAVKYLEEVIATSRPKLDDDMVAGAANNLGN